MYSVPPARAWWPAVGAPLERGVRRQSLAGGHTVLPTTNVATEGKAVQFPVEIHEATVPLLVERLVSITGVEPWTKRFEWLAREVQENSHMGEWLRERCGLEWELGASIESGDLSDTGRFRIQGRASRYELAAFAAGVSYIHEGLSPKGRNRLRGSLVDGLKVDKGLLSVQHEVATAVHLVRSGFDVQFHDLETGGGYDFLAVKGAAEIEVECKMFSADVGRKMHRRLSAKLFKVLEPALGQTFQSAAGGLLVRITLPDRLTPAPSQHNGIRRAVELGLLAGRPFENEYCVVAVQDFAIEGSPFAVSDIGQIQSAAAKEFVGRLAGHTNPTLMILVSPGRSAVVALLESRQPDAVLKGIRRQLRDAAVDQFSGTRPGCLAAQLHDLDDGQLRELATSDSSSRARAHGLQIMTSDLLQAPSRAHILSVVYRARAPVVSEGGAISSPSTTYVMRNAGHPFANDPAYAAFGPTAAPATRIVLST
jgi:hypothetical protein